MNVARLQNFWLKLRKISVIGTAKELLFFSRFFLLVISFLFFDVLRIVSHFWGVAFLTKPFRTPVKKVRDGVLNVFNSRAEGEISSVDLIQLAVRHLTAKKARTFITIGGMSIGFGSVIFLLSLGYGTQKLVVSRVARLEEMKQINVTVGQATALKLNEDAVISFKNIEHVESVIPLVSVVSKVNYNNSISDVVSYGVTRSFLEESAIHPVRGKLFDDGEIETVSFQSENQGQVAGVQTERRTDAKMNKQISQIKYSIYPLVWQAVYEGPSENAKILGYTSRVVGQQDAIEVWGDLYDSDMEVLSGIDLYGNEYRAWIKDSFPLWDAETCNKDSIGCVDGKYRIQQGESGQRFQDGYIQEKEIALDRYQIVPESKPALADGETVEEVQFSFEPQHWYQVYSDTVADAATLNMFTSQVQSEKLYSGELVFGDSYLQRDGWGDVGKNEHGRSVGLWIRAKLPLWRKLDCGDCETLYLTEQDNQERQVEAIVFVRADSASIENMPEAPRFGQVLGEATESASLALTDETTEASVSAEETTISLEDGGVILAQTQADGSLDWVSIASGSGSIQDDKRAVIAFSEKSQRKAVVTRSMLNVLGIDEAEAIDKTFSAVFMLDQEFFDQENYQAESEPTEFTIIGVIPEEKNAAYYIPFSDLKGLGVDNYSQLKVVVDDQKALKDVRQSIESLGYKTTSVVDTVGKINSLFDTIRFVLTILGMVALSVAALGMFNTLTVSLLEKTREVGLMKAIGMKSNEVKRLFLAESIVMGLSGGIVGLFLSTLTGYALSLFLSVFSLTKGLGYINPVYTPAYLALGIIGLSFFIGVLTGMYPSYRATKISALNALRYE